jgi:hypothetical protein
MKTAAKLIKIAALLFIGVLSFLVIFIGFIGLHETTGVIEIEAIILIIGLPIYLLGYILGRVAVNSDPAPSRVQPQLCPSCGKYTEASANSAFCSLCGACRAAAV